MSSIFIGKLSHWLALIVVIVLLVVVGLQKFHVTNFTLLVGFLLTLSFFLVLGVVLNFDKNERITREVIEEDD